MSLERQLLSIFLLSMVFCLSNAQCYRPNPPRPWNIGFPLTKRSVEDKPDSQMFMKNTFAKLARKTSQECLTLLVCQIGARDELFGHLGHMVVDYFRQEDHSFTKMSGQLPAYLLGQAVGSLSRCRNAVPACSLDDDDLQYVADIVTQ